MGTQRDVCSEEKGMKRQLESLPTSPAAGDSVPGWGGGEWCGNQPQDFISSPKPVSGQPFPAKLLPEAN